MASPTRSSGGAGVPPALPSIPLSAEAPDTHSIGGLVREASTQVSNLVRAELKLARSELTTEVKKGAIGAGFFIVALAVFIFSLVFFFIALAELLTYLWFERWSAYLLVFGVMALTAAVAGFIGFLVVRKIRPPRRTISSVRDTASVFTQRGREDTDPAAGRW
ncbi:phage holin family protein [Pseudonocardia eucalypti]|uniref:Phage holin family protein n=1 Tax=Pseudonocardia eucalypti TaxID=648755 RepID=A0ABP9PJ50_9PSEU|nr:hypothetical protein [Pseudonocardia eucalypti]